MTTTVYGFQFDSIKKNDPQTLAFEAYAGNFFISISTNYQRIDCQIILFDSEHDIKANLKFKELDFNSMEEKIKKAFSYREDEILRKSNTTDFDREFKEAFDLIDAFASEGDKFKINNDFHILITDVKEYGYNEDLGDYEYTVISYEAKSNSNTGNDPDFSGEIEFLFNGEEYHRQD